MLSEQNEKQKILCCRTKWNTKKYHTVGTKWKTKNTALSEQNEKQKNYYAVEQNETRKNTILSEQNEKKNVDSKQKEWKPNNLKIFGSKKTKWQAMYPFIT
jgi:hypothetical protein